MGLISGIVKDENGNPVAGNLVRAYRRDSGVMLNSALTDATGAYQINTGTYAGQCTVIAFSGDVGDTHSVKVSSLLHFDGADGSTNFEDATGKVWTPFGNVHIDTSQSVFGGSSAYFDGSGDYLSTPTDSSFNVGADDFTVEMFVRPAEISTRLQAICGKFNTNTYAPFRVELNGSNYNFLITDTGTSWVGGTATLSAPASGVGVADHVALVRLGGTFDLYVNGVKKGSRTQTGALWDNTFAFVIGVMPGYSGNNFKGHLDEFRFTKGIARYTENFTPPSAPFSFGSNTGDRPDLILRTTPV